MKTKEEWTKIRDEMAVAYLFGSSDAEHMQEFAEFIGQIQLDARAELLVELEQAKRERDEARKALVIADAALLKHNNGCFPIDEYPAAAWKREAHLAVRNAIAKQNTQP